MKTNISTPHDSLATRLAGLQQCLKGGGRPLVSAKNASQPLPSPARIIAVSKTHPPERIEEALRLGVTDFGENKVQEAQGKFPSLKANHPELRLHLIGPLQSNKAKEAVALFDVIHTIDRPKIADAVCAELKKQNRVVSCLVQINIGEEPQKAGVLPQDLAALLEHCHTIGLPIHGLMCIPPEGENPAPYFALMYQLKRTHQLAELSMGMSGDYETALRFGATMIRVGTALFGARNHS
ncbi:MAG: YggS family pyridoxal phosphate-dependent enzyme [Alphaproteobacteria bacterium]|nr:YggS family pyridoxal phosphate-dependent enzyme [Alphaproteobacteria bacterium]